MCAIQLFGRNSLERIPPNALSIADDPASHAHMMQVRWEERLYIVFERDLRERTERIRTRGKEWDEDDN